MFRLQWVWFVEFFCDLKKKNKQNIGGIRAEVVAIAKTERREKISAVELGERMKTKTNATTIYAVLYLNLELSWAELQWQTEKKSEKKRFSENEK